MLAYIDRKSAFWDRLKLNHRLKHERLTTSSDFTVVDIEDGTFGNEPIVGELAFVSDFACSQHAAFPRHLPAWEGSTEVRLPLCLIVCDLCEHTFHNGLSGLASHLDRFYRYLVSTYDCPALHALRSMCRETEVFYVVPHHIDMTVFRDFHEPKLCDVFMYGSLSARWYPFRRRLADLLGRGPFRFHLLPHPGYDECRPDCSGGALARMINQAWLSIATPSTESYFLYKYLEIAAAGSVVAGELPAPARTIWNGEYLALSPEMSDTEIVGQIENALTDKDRLRAIAQNMGRKIRATFSLDHYAGRLLDVANDIASRGLGPRSDVWYRLDNS